jgi:hypothetical protein
MSSSSPNYSFSSFHQLNFAEQILSKRATEFFGWARWCCRRAGKSDWSDFGQNDGLMTVWPLDIHDLAASKLMAGRDKDFEFLQFLFIMDCAIFPPAWPDGVVANQPLRPCRPERLEKLAHRLRERHRDDLGRKPTGQ